MSDNRKSKRSDGKSPVDRRCISADFDLYCHSTVKIEYCRSFEYRLKWKGLMSPRSSSSLSKASKKSAQKRCELNEEVNQDRLRSQRRKKKEPEVDTDEESGRDIIDIIESSFTEDAVEKNREEAAEFDCNGLEESNDGVDSDCSTASGPSLLHLATSRRPKPSQSLCSACHKLYQRVKKAKTPIINKLLDNDPKSLTCDQWVLVKKWKPKRLPATKQKLLSQLRLDEISMRLREKRVGAGRSSACKRPLIYLQRNLRLCATAQSKKKRKRNNRKRRSNDNQCSRVAKQQRLQSSNDRKGISTDCMVKRPDSCFSSRAGVVGCTARETNSWVDAVPSADKIPSSAKPETIEPREVQVQKKTPRKRCGFRDLLAQLRGNSSVIVKETH